MKFKKIDFGRQANFILAVILIHFVYLYKAMFSSSSFLSFIILFLIVFIMVYRENFFEYGIRNSLWLVLFIIIESWFWYFFITSRFDIFAAIGRFFISYEGYLTIFTLITTNLFAAIVAALIKEKYEKYKVRTMKIGI